MIAVSGRALGAALVVAAIWVAWGLAVHPAFQPAHLLCHGTLGHVQRLGRGPEAEVPGGGAEGAQSVQRRQPVDQHEVFLQPG